MNEPRPAMISARPDDTRSSVAKSWNTRTGSSELSTVTALVSPIVVVCAAAASTTAGGGGGEVLAVVLTDAVDVQAHLLGDPHLLQQVAQPLTRGGGHPVVGSA